MQLDLTRVPEFSVRRARRAYSNGDAGAFVECANGNHSAIQLVADNAAQLLDRGIFEACFVRAWMMHNTNMGTYSTELIRDLLSKGDRSRFLKAGDPLPGNGPFTVYRGISGTTDRRRPRGPSWTISLDCACWFAWRAGRVERSVVTATVESNEIYAYIRERGEDEIIAFAKYRTMRLSADELNRRAEAYSAAKQAAEDRELEQAILASR